MQTGWFKEVRVKDLDNHAIKALLASRAFLVNVKRDVENQVRGLLKNLGLVVGRAKFNVFAVRAEGLIETSRTAGCDQASTRGAQGHSCSRSTISIVRFTSWLAMMCRSAGS